VNVPIPLFMAPFMPRACRPLRRSCADAAFRDRFIVAATAAASPFTARMRARLPNGEIVKDAETTRGTRAAGVSTPMFLWARKRRTPAAASRPNALPPANTAA